MIRTTNQTKDFIENDKAGDLFIYGAGNAGYWVGHYLRSCGIQFAGYFDQCVVHAEARLNDGVIYSTDKLKEYHGRQIRIIITPNCYKEVLAKLLFLENAYGFDAICLVPEYRNSITRQADYHINRLLSWFRGKLFQGQTPTIFCNSCIGGLIYEHIDRMMLSPTVNTIMYPEDFIKLCRRPRYYMEQEMKEVRWERPFGNPGRQYDWPCGVLDDIRVIFAHTASLEGHAARWNYLRKKINWERVIFLLTETPMQHNIPYGVLKGFFLLEGEKLFISNHGLIPGGKDYEQVYMPVSCLSDRASAIENHFDLLGWLNRECL